MAAMVFDRPATMEARFGRALVSEAVTGAERARLAALATEGRLWARAPAMGMWLMEAGGRTGALGKRLEGAFSGPLARQMLAAGGG